MKLSIVTPSYNQGGFIIQAFNSVLNQKLNGCNLEYLVIDNLSHDQTQKIARDFKEKFERASIPFIFVSKPDKGQADAINKGWQQATGDLFAYLNADDYYNPNVLKNVLDFFNKNPQIDWAYGGWNYVNESGKIIKTINSPVYHKAKLLNFCNIGQPSCFFRKKLLDQAGLLNTNLHLALDYDLWLRFANIKPADIIPVNIANLRYHGQAKSSLKTLGHMNESLFVAKKYTKPFSYRRMLQYYFWFRCFILIKLGLDFPSRIQVK